jgi:hypothetical protein
LDFHVAIDALPSRDPATWTTTTGVFSLLQLACTRFRVLPSSPFGWQLDDKQVSAVASYVRDRFGKHAPPVSESRAQQARSELAARTN